MRSVLVLLASAVILSSCVLNKKLTPLQKGDLKSKDLTMDTVVRTYAVDTFIYKIQSNDIINVEFESLTPKEFDFFSANSQTQQSNQNLQNGLLFGELVDDRGEIPFPVVGKVKVSDLTVFEIQEKLQKLATQYLESPLVKVRLLNYHFTLLGEVVKEGTVTFATNRVSMIEAIGLAGGLGELADRSNIKLIRQKGYETEIVYINLLDENFIQSPYYYVYQNDVLIVRPLSQRPFLKYYGTNLSLLVSSISLLLLTITLVNQ